MTTTELTSILGLIMTIGGGVYWFETKVASVEDIQRIHTQIDAMVVANSVLQDAVDAAEARAKISSNMYTERALISDLEGRNVMYRVLDQVNAITDEQRNRWREVQEAIAFRNERIRNLEAQLERVQ